MENDRRVDINFDADISEHGHRVTANLGGSPEEKDLHREALLKPVSLVVEYGSDGYISRVEVKGFDSESISTALPSLGHAIDKASQAGKKNGGGDALLAGLIVLGLAMFFFTLITKPGRSEECQDHLVCGSKTLSTASLVAEKP